MLKNLLIGAVTNYTWDDVAPFFNSYAQTGFENCDCVMFVANVSEKDINCIESSGAKVIQIASKYRNCSINGYRWEIYRDYLLEHNEEYKMVFIADTRDIIFQRDVFKYYSNKVPFLGLAIEDFDLTDNWSSTWLIKLFGQEAYDSIKNNQQICMGTLWGTVSSVYSFAQQMASYIDRSIYSKRMSDQNIANYLIYHEGILGDQLVIKSNNNDGYVMTIGTRKELIACNNDGLILNGKGEIAAVVHQYDRKPELVKMVHKKYGQGMTILGKLAQACANNIIRRIARFIVNVRKKGFIRVVTEAIKRRIHH